MSDMMRVLRELWSVCWCCGESGRTRPVMMAPRRENDLLFCQKIPFIWVRVINVFILQAMCLWLSLCGVVTFGQACHVVI